MRRVLLTRMAALFALAGLFGSMAGCGGDAIPRGSVKGQVKIGDKNLTAGTVLFTAKDKKATGSAVIDQNGNYEMKDAPVGEVMVSVTVPKVMGIGGKMPQMPNAPADAGMKAGGVDMTAGTGMIDPSKVVPIPEKYADPDSSLLTFKVEKGAQTHNITLTR